jgi:hypothetical protein
LPEPRETEEKQQVRANPDCSISPSLFTFCTLFEAIFHQLRAAYMTPPTILGYRRKPNALQIVMRAV